MGFREKKSKPFKMPERQPVREEPKPEKAPAPKRREEEKVPA